MEKKIPYRQLQNLSFSVYRPQEIRKLSVIEITNPTAFDTLEHPLAGGLYDPHMGPSDYDEKCLTCGLSALHCPGHVGHIVLPLPVFNAVFIKTLYQILQGSCFKCHRLMAPPTAVTLALCQFEALDYGLVGTVQELSEAVSDLSSVTTNESTSMEGAVQEKLHTILLEATSSLDIKECKASSCTKSVVECRQRIMKEFIRTHMTKPRIKCPHCDAKKGKVALRNNSRFVLCNVSKEDSITAKNPGAVEESQGEVSKISERTATVNSPYTNIDLMPTDVKEHLNLLWKKESSLLKHLFGILNVSDDQCESPMNVFFTEMMIVPPTRFRPISVVKGRKFLNAQSAALKDVLTDAVLLKNLLRRMKGEYVSNIDEEQVDKVQGANDQEKLSYLWRQLQNHVNCVYDSDLDKLNKDKTSCGVKQVLEKKEGLFRKHMMGKRVNFAARSVISPDPYIMVDEIGVPTVFAKKLTYPTPVTDWNVEALRQAVINGPNVHPGAEKVEMEDGKIIKLKSDDPVQRRALACKLLTPPSSSTGIQQGSCKKVHRHLQNGDILLLNRQPTLHKPSIMAHKARVLPGEKTLRLHYANCKSYNADFDGDEMNAHYPQSELARAEGYHIVSVNHQYLVPKDGTPLSGLIQDHIIAGTLLTMRGRFFTREEYHQLVYGAIEFVKKSIRTLPPSIIKPKVLWSGKQVVSTVIINLIPEGKPPPTIEGKAKVSVKNWQNAEPRKWHYGGTPLLDISMSESEVIIHSGELLCGVIDKANIGPTPCGLIHCCYELYGGKVSTALLTALAKLFTHFLQIHTGFTLGIEDILLTEEADEKRWQVMRKAAKKGDKVVARAFNVDDPSDKKDIIQKFKQAHLSRDDNGLKMLDYEMKKTTDEVNNKINKICMPNGLMKKFPKNNLQLMVQSGAKGSTVNTMQISCLLGQIELEGRRVPLMLNGSTLPSFRPYDTSPRAGGFVDGRFLTGIKPQEFFFHCMAGREGLVDTAVKTSRSGYLQRCLIKHLEGIVVNYDLTVRDSDGSVIQFLYGEDGWDVCKMQMLKEGNLHLLAKNYDAVINEEIIENFIRHQELPSIPWHRFTGPEEMKRAISKWERKYEPRIGKSRHSPFLKFAAADTDIQPNVHNRRSWLTTKWHHLDQMTRQKFSRSVRKCPDSVTSVYRPDLVFGAVSEKLDAIIEHYIKNKDYGIVRKHGDRASNNGNVRKYLSAEQFKNLAYYKSLNALAHPGEAVGLLAAQSIGEPSTQMTLNTFHFAGRGEMNVTLGIPRLREILMVASANIATPTMDLPLLNVPDVQEKAEKLRVKLSSVHLKQVLETIEVKEVLWVKSLSYRFRDYTVKMNFLPYEVYKGVHYATPGSIISFIEDVFIRDLISYTQKKLASLTSSKLVSFAPKTQKNVGTQEDMDGDQEERAPTQSSPLDLEERGSSDEEEGDGDTVSTKMKTRHTQDLEYEEPEPEEKAQDPEDDDDIEIIEADNTAGGEEDKEGEEGLAADQNFMMIQEKKVKAKAEKHSRVQRLKDKYSCLSHYDYDTKKMSWCEFTLRLNVQNSKLDMHTLVEEAATKAVLYSVPNIRKAFLVKNPNPENGVPKMLKTDGVNFLEVFKYVDIIDMKKVYSNDIHSIAKIYGIEAAARVIVNEIKNVFATYGIEVDPRHLLLIADYMTFDGTYKPCNRIGMASNASPLQQMSFETTMNFLQSAALAGSEEQLKSPSSRLVVGKLVGGGTGIFDLWQKFAHRS